MQGDTKQFALPKTPRPHRAHLVNNVKLINLDVLPDGDIHDKDFDPAKHEFVSHILAAKARVTPLKTGLTIPQFRIIQPIQQELYHQAMPI